MSGLRQGSTFVELDIDQCTPPELLLVQRLARELRLTDQILSTDVDTVSVMKTGPFPAWTTLDGDKVSFAWDKMPSPKSRMSVAVWLGTNAHELGHVLFSPRKDSTLMFRVLESDRTFMRGVAMLHNIVEDQREERLLLARFAPWTGYLTAALGHHLKVDGGAAWLLFAGRTWLPQAVRDQAQAAMIAQYGMHVTNETTRIVGAYQRLTDPGDLDADEAWELLQELHAIFADDMPSIPTGCTVMEGGTPNTDEPGADAPATADEVGDDDGEGDGGQADGDEGDDGDSNASGAGSEPGDASRSVKEQLKRHAERQIENDDDASGDLDNIVEALEYGRSGDRAEGEDAIGHLSDATDAARQLHRTVSDALLDLKDDSEPGWLKRVDSGRLKVARVIDPNVPFDQLFDRYEPGMLESSELEVVLLLDVSGSMGSYVRPLAEATWAIRHAVDDLEGRIHVFTWDSGPHRVLADAGDRPDGRMFVPRSMGGTNPTSALTEALRLLSGSDAKNRLMVIMTDSDWDYGAGRAERVIDAMNVEGITTVCALLGQYVSDDFHQCQHGGSIEGPHELALLFRQVAAERIMSWR